MEKKNIKNLLIGAGVLILIIWLLVIPSNDGDYSILSFNKDNFSNVEELHFSHMPITYKINNLGCSDIQINHFLKGLNIVQNLTDGLVSFVKVFNEPDLKINCIDRDFLFEKFTTCEEIIVEGHPTTINWNKEGYLNQSEKAFISANKINQTDTIEIWELCSASLEELGFSINNEILGEGGPSEIMGNIIVKGEINLYQGFEESKTCTFPSKEIHELFHSFGFDHSHEPFWDPYYGYVDWEPVKDIMFPHNYCQFQKEIQEKYISCLKYIYSNGEIGKCSFEVNFLGSTGVCRDNWYPVENSDYCCPEPNMIINEGGYCE